MNGPCALRFPLSEIRSWADRYSYEDDSAVSAMGEAVRERGWYKRGEFLSVTRWKTQRSKNRCALNTAASIREATYVALHAKDERLRIGVLTLVGEHERCREIATRSAEAIEVSRA